MYAIILYFIHLCNCFFSGFTHCAKRNNRGNMITGYKYQYLNNFLKIIGRESVYVLLRTREHSGRPSTTNPIPYTTNNIFIIQIFIKKKLLFSCI